MLKAFYSITDTLPRQTDICVRLVLRILDEDDTVRVSISVKQEILSTCSKILKKDLAVRSIEELWFPLVSSDQDTLNTAAVIMSVSGYFKDRQSPLEDVLSKIVSEKDGGDTHSLRARFTSVFDAMIDGLIDPSDLKNFVSLNFILTVSV